MSKTNVDYARKIAKALKLINEAELYVAGTKDFTEHSELRDKLSKLFTSTGYQFAAECSPRIMRRKPDPRDYTADDFQHLIVTGKLRNGKRFREQYASNVSSFMMVRGINLWNGRIWGVLKNGKRVLLKSVIN